MNYIIRNIRQFATKNTLIFVLFIVCEFAAAFILFLSFGTYQNFKLLKTNDLHKSDISIGFGNVVNKTVNGDDVFYDCDGAVKNDEVKKFLSLLSADTLKEIEGIIYIASTNDYTHFENNNEPLSICFRLEYSQEDKRFVPYKTAFNNSPSLYGEYISLEDYNNGTKAVVLPMNFPSEAVGKKIKINNCDYRVIGIDAVDEYATIPYINSPGSLDNIFQICFITNNIISQKSYNNIADSLNKVFGDYAFIPKVDTIDTKLPFYNSIMLISVVLTCLAAVTLALLFKYILSTRNRFISVLRICGCTNNKVRRIFISEIIFTSIITFILGAVCYFGFAVNKLRSALVYINIVYNLKNCLILSAIYFICIYVILNIMITVTLIKSPVTQIKQGGF